MPLCLFVIEGVAGMEMFSAKRKHKIQTPFPSHLQV